MVHPASHPAAAGWPRLMRLAGVFFLLLACAGAQAATSGEVRARICGTGIPGYCGEDSLPVPWWATQYQTPVLDLARDTANVFQSVRSRAGIDVPAGALNGALQLDTDVWEPVDTPISEARTRVQFEDVIEVRSPTLPQGTWVEFELRSLLAWDVPALDASHGTVNNTVLISVCLDGVAPNGCMAIVPQQFFFGHGSLDLGTATVRAQIGDDLGLLVALDMSTTGSASAFYEWVDDHSILRTGHATVHAAIALLFGIDAGADPPAGEGMVALAGSGLELYSQALAGPPPGFEVFDEANIAAQLQPIPAPPALALFAPALAALALRSRRRRIAR